MTGPPSHAATREDRARINKDAYHNTQIRAIFSSSRMLFFETQAKHSFTRLVTAYNIDNYLRDLFSERAHLGYMLKRWNTMSVWDMAIQKSAAALTDQDLKAGQKTWLYVDK
ncbi:hypothetical protein M406DRAFT_74143 [Cryphonectria parasitica EP155]|uniref:Uncharacterized protein n=1 Tax=Cryphonectria parasitica (strain ATCC 38755 / EP155) TaxID=660469 RepID=A0A9P5CMX9_CRYP1|nr:uncharacterized protein M406DRAFT_74143 [Cryphonectria parasitica EP155]KAF3763551.1 hypothetical protein M406DRAFT_74143 [Cryphonectria parasitica EP155]